MITFSNRLAARIVISRRSHPDLLKDILHDPKTPEAMQERCRYLLAHPYADVQDTRTALDFFRFVVSLCWLVTCSMVSLEFLAGTESLSPLAIIAYVATTLVLAWVVYERRRLQRL
jgi:hypothetical protein